MELLLRDWLSVTLLLVLAFVLLDLKHRGSMLLGSLKVLKLLM